MTRRIGGFLASLAVAVALVAGGPAAQADVPAQLDANHYWSWTLPDPIYVPDQILVWDQFIREPSPLFELRLERLLNPATKRHDAWVYPIVDSTLHLTWYDVQPKYPVEQEVVIYDQFYPDGFTSVVGDLAFMLVPASKDTLVSPPPPPAPGEATHYLCYRFMVPPPGIPVGLEDQFRRTPGVPVGEGKFLCVPCWKRHLELEYPPRDRHTHYVVYEVSDPYPLFHFPMVWDQFLLGQWPVYQTPSEWLFVPAVKIPTSVGEKGRTESSWGALKQIYR
jgi:hypothetical protein